MVYSVQSWRQRPETPGDLAVIEELPAEQTRSAERLKAVLEADRWIRAQPTEVLLRARDFARGCGFATVISGRTDFIPWRHDGHGLVLPFELIKAVLATREHVPNLIERKHKRLASAAQKRGQRPPRPRR